MTVVTRFAPSPTGYLHIGNARTALLCALLAKKHGGTFILRIDDTDVERSKSEYEQALKEDLNAMGVFWDRSFRQSERTARYAETVEQLKKEGRLYECFETPEEIDVKRKTLLARGLPPIYDREGWRLSDAQKSAFLKEGRRPHLRFKLEHNGAIAWKDLIRGDISFNPELLSDPVLIRENGTPTYMLPSAVDDVDFGVTHILRGEDHITNTAVQVQLFEALGASAPQFAHLSLIQAMEGKISKRKGGFDIRAMMQEHGVEPEALAGYLARVGTSEPIVPMTTLDEAVQGFDFSVFSRSSCKFDPEELQRLNAKTVRMLPYEKIEARLTQYGADLALWQAAKANVNTLKDVEMWANLCRKPVAPVIEEADYVAQAAELLPATPWDRQTWKSWTTSVAAKTGRKGKKLFLPLRLALTALPHGPELDDLLPLIGHERASLRLRGARA